MNVVKLLKGAATLKKTVCLVLQACLYGNLPVLPSGSRFSIRIYQRPPTVGLIDSSLFFFYISIHFSRTCLRYQERLKYRC